MAPLLPALLGAGCSDDPGPRQEAAPRNVPALYGDPARPASVAVPRARPFDPAAGGWQQAGFCCVETELSPATLYHSTSRHLGVFTGLERFGLGAPSSLAFSTRQGPRSFQRGQALDPAGMEENWVLVWFAGAPGWTQWDSPWAVFLQHKPVAMRLEADGLHFEFSERAGDVVLMPLYGYDKLPLEGKDYPARQASPRQRRETWKWSEGLRTAQLMRLRYWASATREFPWYVEDTFCVDRAQDSVILRQRFQFHSIPDDWHTRHLKVAPLSPPLAQAMQDQDFPAKISGPIMDYDYVTPYGPYAGIENADRYDATFPLLTYIHETEQTTLPTAQAHPAVRLAWEQLRELGRAQFNRAPVFGSAANARPDLCAQVLELSEFARALPNYDDATRANALASLRQFVREQVLVTNRLTLREFPAGSGRSYSELKCLGNHPGGGSVWAGQGHVNLPEILWTYAHFTGDWDVIRERWDLVKRLLASPARSRWATFGSAAHAPLGDAAAACLAMARLAYRVGDLDTYHYACYLFVRELVLDWLKLRGLDYVRRHQPWHTLSLLESERRLTMLTDDPAGWQIDSPNPPIEADARHDAPRWEFFHNADVGRFFRDYLGREVQWELDRLLRRWDSEPGAIRADRYMPRLLQLRSLLLNPSPEVLARTATPAEFPDTATCLSVLRVSQAASYQRLIPPGPPSAFAVGLEREVAGANTGLVPGVQCREAGLTGAEHAAWPWIAWRAWKTPTGRPWSFGHVKPVVEDSPPPVREFNLNWNTRVMVYDWSAK